MADIFRKKSLEKLVSTEQLDRMITIIKPSFWIVFFAAAIIVVAGLVWGIFGRLPLCIDGIGIVHQEGHQTEQTIFCYLPLEEGKQVQQGMKVVITPSGNSNKQQKELIGSVVNVESYVSTKQELQQQLGNESLVEYFLKDGPVVTIQWKVDRQQDMPFLDGTLIECSIVLEEKTPISFLLPLTVGIHRLDNTEGEKF